MLRRPASGDSVDMAEKCLNNTSDVHHKIQYKELSQNQDTLEISSNSRFQEYGKY